MAYPDLSNYQGTVDPASFRARLEQSNAPVAQQPNFSTTAPSYVSTPAPSYTPTRAPAAYTPSPTPAPPMPNMDAIRRQMDANSTAYNQTSDTAEQTRLHDENLRLGAQIGATYNPNGEWTFPSPPPPSGQQQSAGIGQPGPTAQFIPGVGTVVPGMGVFPTGSSQPNIPTPGMPQGLPAPMTPQQIQAEAQARIDKLLAQKNQVATQQKQSLQTEFDRQQGLNQDNRVLQDAQFARTNNPFSGGTDYRRAMLDRERNITDRQAQQDLSSRLANIDSALADFQNLSEEQRQSIINELTTQERGYGLQLAQMLQGQSNADRNFGLEQQRFDYGRERDTIQDTGRLPNGQLTQQGMANQLAILNSTIMNEINSLKLQNLPRELELGLTKLQQDVASGNIGLETAQFQLEQLKDPESPLNRKQALELEIKQIERDNLPQEQKLRLQQLQKTIDNIGKAPYRSPEEVEFDKVKLQTAQKQLELLNNPQPKPGTPKTAEDYAKIIDDSIYLAPKLDENGMKRGMEVVDPKGLGDYIFSLGLSEPETRKLYARYGLKWGE